VGAGFGGWFAVAASWSRRSKMLIRNVAQTPDKFAQVIMHNVI
jgi:hypothetical protein